VRGYQALPAMGLCVYVCHTSIVSVRLNGSSSFLAQRHSLGVSYTVLAYQEIWVSPTGTGIDAEPTGATGHLPRYS